MGRQVQRAIIVAVLAALAACKSERPTPRELPPAVPPANAAQLVAASFTTSSLPVPSLTLLGTVDTVISNPNARNAFELLVEIRETGHYAFSDFCLQASNCNPPITLTNDESHDAVLR